MIKTLKRSGNQLSDRERQVEFLENGIFKEGSLPKFSQNISSLGPDGLKPDRLEILQINVGYMCNQTCKHCHVDAGPDRKEIMSRETMEQCLEVVRKFNIPTIDITGGAPEMNPDFRWLVREARQSGCKEIIVRSNLTIITANPKYHDLPEFYRDHDVRVVSSLPFYRADKTDRQRGKGVFDQSIKALKMLNEVGYGGKHILDLVYNPAGAFLPGDQSALEKEFKRELKDHHDVIFNNLLTITNVPVNRFLDFLIETENYEEYMETLVGAFNPATLRGLMCKNTLSVSWNGFLYDCDFNQMLGLKINDNGDARISQIDQLALQKRNIVIGQHCYGCTAGTGSSCQGSLV